MNGPSPYENVILTPLSRLEWIFFEGGGLGLGRPRPGPPPRPPSKKIHSRLGKDVDGLGGHQMTSMASEVKFDLDLKQATSIPLAYIGILPLKAILVSSEDMAASKYSHLTSELNSVINKKNL